MAKNKLFTNFAKIILLILALKAFIFRNKKIIDKELIMKDIISKTLTSHNLEDAVKNISTEIGKLFGADRVHFRFYDASINAFSKVIEEYRKDASVPSAKGKIIYPKDFEKFLSEKIYKHNKIFFLNDINKPEYSEKFRNLFADLDIKNEIVIPIFFDHNPEGAFFITNTKYAEQWKEKDIEELMPVLQQISIGTHLFRLNDSLNKASEYDRILREIILETRGYEEPEEIFRYLLQRFTDLFHIDRVLDLKQDSKNDIYVFYEELRDEKLGRFKDEIIFYEKDYNELFLQEEKQIIVVNDIEEILVPSIKEGLRNKNIEAFLLYPIYEIIPELKKEKTTNRIMICSQIARLWTPEEIDALKLIVGTLAVIFVEVRRRKELNEIRQTFLAMLTHDLKSPLIAEQKALEMMLSKSPDSALGEFQEYLADIHNTNDELLRIITNILTAYHVDTGQFELKIEPYNIKNIIDESIKSMRHLALDQGSEINNEIQDSLPLVNLDVTEITRVVINLLNNAIKHNQRNTNITIKTIGNDKEIQVSISDNGKGISEEEKPNIFQKYPTTMRKIGTGLGLYLSKQIIEAHHGKIWFETEKDKGTTFYFTLPVV